MRCRSARQSKVAWPLALRGAPEWSRCCRDRPAAACWFYCTDAGRNRAGLRVTTGVVASAGDAASRVTTGNQKSTSLGHLRRAFPEGEIHTRRAMGIHRDRFAPDYGIGENRTLHPHLGRDVIE